MGTFNKKYALAGALSGHFEISRSPVDSSSVRSISQHFTNKWAHSRATRGEIVAGEGEGEQGT